MTNTVNPIDAAAPRSLHARQVRREDGMSPMVALGIAIAIEAAVIAAAIHVHQPRPPAPKPPPVMMAAIVTPKPPPPPPPPVIKKIVKHLVPKAPPHPAPAAPARPAVPVHDNAPAVAAAPAPLPAVPSAATAASKAPAGPAAVDIAIECPVQIKPQTPAKALAEGLSGEVTARATIQAGRVVAVDIVRSQPARVFDDAVRRAMRQYQCRTNGDEAIVVEQTFEFAVGD
ncbi:energy transducer TonB [Burkholderia sp. Ac-20379]|uniref:energy transducer TonB n=1 Tax=Burkholderia sp. Ac-20379 TaxID=2703900 RepID=UPI00197EEC7D|nr:energy transducer TonB [Burkholderia sp. Ac-20379]MBN3723068.1 energy transducer TonB [Burkholderia sp. Ac-20379]